ncbi:MAG: hypothetical protein AAF478_13190 [Pseudomonadota bacterium]
MLDGNGSTTVFNFPFYVEDAGDLAVYIRDANDAETLQTITTHYAVSGTGTNSVDVTFVTAPSANEKVTIIREEPVTNETSADSINSFRGQNFENQFDRFARADQRLLDLAGRSIQYRKTDVVGGGDEAWDFLGKDVVNIEGIVSTSNVQAAGAIMDGDFTSNGLMKRTGAGTYETAVEDTDYQGVLAEGAFADGDKTKLDNIEANADVTDTANVTAAGALMDSEVTSLSGIKTAIIVDNATVLTEDATTRTSSTEELTPTGTDKKTTLTNVSSNQVPTTFEIIRRAERLTPRDVDPDASTAAERGTALQTLFSRIISTGYKGVVNLEDWEYQLSSGFALPNNIILESHRAILDGEALTQTDLLLADGVRQFISAVGGGLTALPGNFSADVNYLQTLLPTSSPHGLSAGDLIIAHDSRDWSFFKPDGSNGFTGPAGRENYQNGEYIKVLDVPSTTTIAFEGIREHVGYESAYTNLFKMNNPWTGRITGNGLTILAPKHTTASHYAFYGRWMERVNFEGIDIVGGSLATLSFWNAYDVDISDITGIDDDSSDFSTDYFISDSNVQRKRARNIVARAARHAFTHGGGAGNGAVPCRDVRWEGCRGYAAENFSFDVHGNAESVQFHDCDMLTGITAGGSDIKITNSRIHNFPNNTSGVDFQELRGGDHTIFDCTLISPNNSGVSNDGAFIRMGRGSAENTEHAVRSMLLDIDRLKLNIEDTAVHTICRFDNYNTTQKMNARAKNIIKKDGNDYNTLLWHTIRVAANPPKFIETDNLEGFDSLIYPNFWASVPAGTDPLSYKDETREGYFDVTLPQGTAIGSGTLSGASNFSNHAFTNAPDVTLHVTRTSGSNDSVIVEPKLVSGFPSATQIRVFLELTAGTIPAGGLTFRVWWRAVSQKAA